MGQGGKISSVIVDGLTVTDKEQIPDIFNDHFVSLLAVKLAIISELQIYQQL